MTRKPFTLEEARSAGLTLSSLRGQSWRRLGAELYCWKDLPEDPWQLLKVLLGSLPPRTVFGGQTAAWIHGLDFDPTNPIEIIVPRGAGGRSRPGLNVRRCEVRSSETVTVRGMRATTLLRTLTDLCIRWPAVEALIAIDMALHLDLADAAAMCRHAEAAKGRAGARRLRLLADIAAPAESPMETRLRWLLVQAGLSSPEVQTDLHDREGRFVGRADLYYPRARLILEYDGGNHRERLVTDDRRQNLLVNAGFTVLRFTAADIHQRPHIVEAQVRGALAATSPAASPAARLSPNARNHRPRRAPLEPNVRNSRRSRWPSLMR